MGLNNYTLSIMKAIEMQTLKVMYATILESVPCEKLWEGSVFLWRILGTLGIPMHIGGSVVVGSQWLNLIFTSKFMK